MNRRLKRAGGVFVVLAGSTVGLAMVLVVVPLRDPPRPLVASPLRIENVGIVDVERGVVLPHRTVLVDAGTIVAVSSGDGLPSLSDAVVIDGSGRYLIPGLWDMHVHHGGEWSPWLSMPLFIANGVTGVREMGGYADDATKERWRSRIRAGEMLGPRGPGRAVRSVFSLPDAASARRVVAGVESGNDFVKVYDGLLDEPYFALLAAADRAGVPVVGHRPRAIAALEAVRAGQRSLEHARLFLFECYAGSADLREAYRRRYAGAEGSGRRIDDTDAMRAMLDHHSSEMCMELYAAMVEHGTWFCPTHVTRKMDAMADDQGYRDDPRLRFIPWLKRQNWERDADGMIARDPTSRGRETYREFYAKGLELTGEAHATGVKILAGTDANDTYCFPGSSLHDELRELVQAGLTPAEALRTATTNPAAYFGMSDRFGAIAEGMQADLVLLDANPLDDIASTRRIQAVVYRGAYYPRRELDRLLSDVERNASSWRIAARSVWGLIGG